VHLRNKNISIVKNKNIDVDILIFIKDTNHHKKIISYTKWKCEKLYQLSSECKKLFKKTKFVKRTIKMRKDKIIFLLSIFFVRQFFLPVSHKNIYIQKLKLIEVGLLEFLEVDFAEKILMHTPEWL